MRSCKWRSRSNKSTLFSSNQNLQTQKNSNQTRELLRRLQTLLRIHSSLMKTTWSCHLAFLETLAKMSRQRTKRCATKPLLRVQPLTRQLTGAAQWRSAKEARLTSLLKHGPARSIDRSKLSLHRRKPASPAPQIVLDKAQLVASMHQAQRRDANWHKLSLASATQAA